MINPKASVVTSSATGKKLARSATVLSRKGSVMGGTNTQHRRPWVIAKVTASNIIDLEHHDPRETSYAAYIAWIKDEHVRDEYRVENSNKPEDAGEAILETLVVRYGIERSHRPSTWFPNEGEIIATIADSNEEDTNSDKLTMMRMTMTMTMKIRTRTKAGKEKKSRREPG